MRLVLDIFCGGGSFGEVAREFGYEVVSLDSRRRKGVCEPTIKSDLNKVRSSFFSSMDVDIAWFGLPCDIWSNASGGFHLDENYLPKTLKACEHFNLLFKTMSIIENSNIGYWFIENPRGKLNRYPVFLDWLNKVHGTLHFCTLSSYGFPTTKPTMIATNFNELRLKDLSSFGRGAKNKVTGAFDNMTKTQRQKTPLPLIRDIFRQIQST